ncbi:monocarboxylate transporter 5-like [Argopecten irradians]|uniref:monocarboxylate transporter 5-like n=1 Tax=Argopecten irradians TaxID=31199 RepID=UPI003719CF59
MMSEATRDPRIPVDRGWAWMVLVGSLLIATITVGTEKSYGIFFIEFLKAFQGTVLMTVMINTITTVVYCFAAAIMLCVGFNRLSVRGSVFLGIILSTIGYGTSSFATGLGYLLASQSILIGIGGALNNPPIYMLLGEYFDKKKGLANAIFISGNSLGGIIMPPLYRYVFDQYGLRGGLIITAGITFNALVAASLLRPTTFYTKNRRTEFSDNGVTNVSNCEDKTPEKYSNSFKEETQYPLISQTTVREEDENVSNDVFETVSRSNFVRYLSNGNIASNSLSSLPHMMERSIEATKDESLRSDGLVLKCKNRIDCSLLRNGLFILFLAIYCLGNVPIMCAHIYIPTYCRDRGIDDQSIAIIVSITSITDFFGRILAGFLADQPSFRSHWIVIFSQVAVGLILQFTVYYSSFWRLVIFVACFGSIAGMIAALFPPMMIEIVGMKRYSAAMAIFIIVICLFNGSVLPILGYFRDVTNTFHLTFHVMGASSFAAVLLLVIFDVIMRKRERKKEKETVKE